MICKFHFSELIRNVNDAEYYNEERNELSEHNCARKDMIRQG